MFVDIFVVYNCIPLICSVPVSLWCQPVCINSFLGNINKERMSFGESKTNHGLFIKTFCLNYNTFLFKDRLGEDLTASNGSVLDYCMLPLPKWLNKLCVGCILSLLSSSHSLLYIFISFSGASELIKCIKVKDIQVSGV